MVSRSGNQKGGGYGSRQHVEKPVRTGSGSHSTRPAGATNIGLMYGTHSTNQRREGDFRGERLHNPERNFQPVKFGNEVALNVGKGGCGTGRTLYGQAGSQGVHGATNPGAPTALRSHAPSGEGPSGDA
jgi:hypothetical protein